MSEFEFIRPIIFLTLLAFLCFWEIKKPRRALNLPKRKRWTNNLALVVLNSLIIRALLPFTLVAFTDYLHSENLTILNSTKLPTPFEVIISLLILDISIYFQHVLTHKIPLLWRLHRVHHADLDLDVSSGGRFHSIEIVLSLLFKGLLIWIFGFSALSVLIFEIILNALSMFNHSNIDIPVKVDNFLRKFVVTPDMHRIHHSKEHYEMNSNYAFNISLWDRVFKTYTEEPDKGQLKMEIGLKEFNQNESISLFKLLKIPFLNK